MEKWIGPIESRRLHDWVMMEARGVLAPLNKASYRQSLSDARKAQILYWTERGICNFSLLCWSSNAEALRARLDTAPDVRFAFIGDVSAYCWLADYILGRAPLYSRRACDESLVAQQRILIEQSQINLTWVRPLPSDQFPFFPVVL